jgi:DivIVA domain-containing protein
VATLDETVSEALTPTDVRATSFPETEFGYDKARVDAFIRAIADEFERLEAELAAAIARAEEPYHQVGREMGSLLQHARDAADELKRKSELEAATMMQNAEKTVAKADEEVRILKKRAEQEADAILREARVEAGRLHQKAADMHRLAQAEASVGMREAERDARKVLGEASREAERVRTQAMGNLGQERIELEKRVRRLKEVEETLRKRVAALGEKLRQAPAQPASFEPRGPESEDAGDSPISEQGEFVRLLPPPQHET